MGADLDDPRYLTVSEAARILRVGRNGLYEAIRRGEVPHLRVGRSIRIPSKALAEWRIPSRTEHEPSPAFLGGARNTPTKEDDHDEA